LISFKNFSLLALRNGALPGGVVLYLEGMDFTGTASTGTTSLISEGSLNQSEAWTAGVSGMEGPFMGHRLERGIYDRDAPTSEPTGGLPPYLLPPTFHKPFTIILD